jgi:hypothetical protein
MIKRDSRGHLYSIVRGEILGFIEDKLLRKHLPRMFSLIRNESQGIEDDQWSVTSSHVRCNAIPFAYLVVNSASLKC